MVYTILCIYKYNATQYYAYIQRVYGHKHVIYAQHFIRFLQYIHTMYMK